MKKRKLRIVALMLLVALIIPCYANAGDGEVQKDKMLTDEEQYELMLKQAPAMAAYEQLMDAWTKDAFPVYPEAFGGFYHTDDFKLAVKVVNNDERFIAEVMEIVDNPEILEFIETDISINGLIALQKSLREEYQDLSFSSGINQVDSAVNIRICKAEGVQQRMPALARLANTPHVTVSIADKPAEMQSITYNPGRMIFSQPSATSSLNGLGTLGWYGTYSFPNKGRVACFLTAGHVQAAFQENTLDMYFGNTKVFSAEDYPVKGTYSNKDCVVVSGGGRTANYRPKGDSYGDFAVMSCISTHVKNADILTSNKIYIGTTTMTVTDYFGSSKKSEILQHQIDLSDDNCADLLPIIPADTRVAKGWGVGESTVAYGIVSEVYATFAYDNTGKIGGSGSKGNIYGCVKIDPQSSKPFSVSGDSGGPVYYVNAQGKVSLLGIISGGDIDNYSYATSTAMLLWHGFIPLVG